MKGYKVGIGKRMIGCMMIVMLCSINGVTVQAKEHDEKGEQRDGALFKEYKVQKAYYEAGVRKRTCRMVPVMENQTQKNRA